MRNHGIVETLTVCLALAACSRTPNADEPTSDAAQTLNEVQAIQVDGASVLHAASVQGWTRDVEGLRPQLPGAAPTGQTWADVQLGADAASPWTLAARNTSPMRLSIRLEGAAPSAKAAVQEGYVLYERALNDATLLHRASRWGVEDYVYFPTKPASEQLKFRVDLQEGVAGLRFVGGTLEFLHADGSQGLRMATPFAVDHGGRRFSPEVRITGCAYESSPAVYNLGQAPRIGAQSCTVSLDWAKQDAHYPLLVDPEWTAPSQLPASFQSWAPQMQKLASGDVFLSGNSTNPSQIWRASTGVWAATGTTSVACNAGQGRAVLQNDGNVLALSGVSGGVALSNVQLYTVSSGTWSARAAMPVAKYRPGVVTLSSGEVLLSGGGDGGLGTIYNTTHTYSPTTNSWTARGAMATARRDHALVVTAANRALAVGGTSSGGCAPVAAAELYNTASGTWASGGSAPAGIVSPNVLMLSTGRVLVSGSYCDGLSSGLFNPAGSVWTNPGSMGTTMGNLGSQGIAEVGGIVYGLGSGVTNTNAYNVGAGTWGAGPTLAQSTSDSMTITLNDGRILAVGLTGETQLLSICGDGVLNGGEACDDGNAASGDGCSASCSVEAGYECARNNIVANGDFELPLNPIGTYTVYPNGTILGGTGGQWLVGGNDVEIDNSLWTTPSGRQSIDMSGNNPGSVSQTISTVAGRRYVWQLRAGSNGAGAREASLGIVSGPTSLSWTLRTKVDVRVSSGVWDLFSGSFTAGGASTTLTITGLTAGGAGVILDDVRAYDVTALACTPLCGNGVLNAGESCDDGNTTAGDGCSATCTTELGFSCPRVSSLANGDAEQPVLADATCSTYAGGSTSATGWTVAGADIKQCNNTGFTSPTGMQVFELNGTAPGGVTQSFGTVSGRTYAWEARLAQNNGCGAATKTGYVNVQSGASVNITTNFSTATAWSAGTWDLISGSFTAGSATTSLLLFSTTTGSCGPAVDAIRVYDLGVPLCAPSCGNGIVGAGEGCDDGNTTAGDGCSATCTVESGAVCDTPTNLIVNGSFETPLVPASSWASFTGATLPSWTVAANTDVDVVSNGFSGLVSAAGAQALDSNGARTGMVSQAVGTTASTSYVWSARVANLVAGTRSAAISLASGSGNTRTWLASSSTLASSANWDTVGGVFAAGSASTTLSYQSLVTGTGGLYADDVRLSTVQKCNCDGNYGTGTPRACTGTAEPICNAGLCQADATAACP